MFVMLLLTIANLAGKILGFFKDVLISNYYGVSARTDAFFLAISIPTILIGVFTSSTDSVIVPQYTRILEGKGGRKAADRFFSNVITVLTVLILAITAATILAPKSVVGLFAPKFSADQTEQAAEYLRLVSPMGLLHVWYCFFIAYLLCFRKTGVRIILCFSTNAIIVAALLLVRDAEMKNIALAHLLASLISALLPMTCSFSSGYRYQPVLSLREYEFPSFFKFFLPVMGSALLADLLLYSDRFLSSFLRTGSLSFLNYASKIINIFDNILVVGIGAVILPLLTRIHLKGDMPSFRKTATTIYFCSTVILLPIAISCILYAQDIISAIYYRGAFTQEDVMQTSIVLQGYAMQILLLPMQFILLKTFHSMQDTVVPFRISCITCIVNLTSSAILMQWFSTLGIALGTMISTLVGCFLLLKKFSEKVGFDRTLFSIRNVIKLLLCNAFILLIFYFLPKEGLSSSVRLGIGIATGLICYLLCLAIFRKELRICTVVLSQK